MQVVKHGLRALIHQLRLQVRPAQGRQGHVRPHQPIEPVLSQATYTHELAGKTLAHAVRVPIRVGRGGARHLQLGRA